MKLVRDLLLAVLFFGFPFVCVYVFWFALWMVCPVCVCVCVRMRTALWLLLPGQCIYFQEVLPVLAAKHCIMQANAELHQSLLAKQKKRFGEEIARLQVHTHTHITQCSLQCF